jgi:hypothetical protein
VILRVESHRIYEMVIELEQRLLRMEKEVKELRDANRVPGQMDTLDYGSWQKKPTEIQDW